jgi:hypothetical protein
MKAEEQERLIISLQDHVNNITNLRYGNYCLAESLTQRTKRLALKFFPEKGIFLDEIDKVNFKLAENKVNIWNESYRRLLTISQAMLDEVQLPSESNNIITSSLNEIHTSIDGKERKLYTGAFLALASLILWTFNVIIKWAWLSMHPKKIAIYLSLQVK